MKLTGIVEEIEAEEDQMQQPRRQFWKKQLSKCICYAQRSKTLIGQKKWPQHVLVLEKQPPREMSCYGCFKTTTTRSGIRETATMRNVVLWLFISLVIYW